MEGGYFSRGVKFGLTLYATYLGGSQLTNYYFMPNQNFPANPMVITLDHFNQMRDHFKKHYFLSQCNVNFGGQEIQVPWNSFSQAVHNFINANNVPPSLVAIRFVHCYDVNNNVLYLRIQILTMTHVQGHPNTFNLVDNPCAWYKLANGTMVPTSDTILFDQDYLNNFYYCNALLQCTPASLHNLAADQARKLYARTVTMPWSQEISQLFTDNGSPANATLCIDACAPLSIVTPAALFQHGLVLFLRRHDGTPMLDNNVGGLPFHNKAADCGTMCPPYCGVYITPVL